MTDATVVLWSRRRRRQYETQGAASAATSLSLTIDTPQWSLAHSSAAGGTGLAFGSARPQYIDQYIAPATESPPRLDRLWAIRARGGVTSALTNGSVLRSDGTTPHQPFDAHQPARTRSRRR